MRAQSCRKPRRSATAAELLFASTLKILDRSNIDARLHDMTRASVLEEIGQTRPFTSASQEGLIALLRTAALLRYAFDAVVEVRDVTGQQYNVLRILEGARAPLATMDIAGRLIEPTPGATRLLDRLEAKGLIRRSRCVEDRRRVLCELTAAGREVLVALRPAVDAFDREAFSSLSKDETRRLIEALDAVRDGLRPACAT